MSLRLRLFFAFTVGLFAAVAHAGTTGTALVRHAPSINGTVDGSLQQMTGESATLNGGSTLTADWLVPGTPTINLNGKPTYGGAIDGTGATTPTGYTLTLNGGATLGRIVRRTNATALPTVTAPPQPTGTRTVTINSSTDAVGSFSTLRNLTLNGNVGQFAIPGGTYGDFIANGGSGFTFGSAGSTQPTVYNFQHLTLNGLTTINVVGPVVINIANGFTANGNMGSSQNLAWLAVNIYSGAFTLNGGCSLYGSLKAPNSTVTINGNSQLIGGLACDRLIVNGRGLVRLSNLTSAPPAVTITAPATNSVFAAPASIVVQATATDSDGTIAKVDFFAGTTLIGSTTTAPYQVTWAASVAGSYNLTAVATDNSGQTATSPAITVVVDAPPAVSLTAPVANAVFTAPASFTLQATATDSDGTVAKVAFYNGSTKLGESTAAPYQFAWSNVPSGSYTLTAVATDDRGISTTSTAVPVVVNALPTVAITAPASGSSYTAPASISLQATASDSDGTIAKVQFYNGATLIGESSAAPYQVTWSNVGTGSYSVTAVAVDNRGGTATSAAITVQVVSPNAPPTVALTSPHTGDVFTAPASFILVASAADSDGTVAKVEFFQGATKLGEVSAAPYQIAVAGLDSGSYTFTARATDNQGAVATSASVTIVSNAAPTVALTAPAAGTVIAAPATVLLQANASDTDGSVAKVEFFGGATKLGEATTAPYQFNWTNVAAGTYSLTAVATDNRGATATSTAVALIVDTPPTVGITTPASNAVFDTPATIAIAATAADADGSVAKVEFFADAAKIGEAVTAPFQFTWTGMPAGPHVLFARATDNNGIATDSANVPILVNVPPVVSISAPADATVYVAPGSFTISADATDSDGTITKVEFFNGTNKLGESSTAPYQLALSNLAAAKYTLTARATDNVGSVTTSAVVNVTVNAPPTVTITSPANNTVFPALTDITVTAAPVDTDGTIAKVEFFAGATKIGEATAAPYQFTWAAVPAGTYSITAKVTDDLGATGTSTPVTVIANAAPTVSLTSPVTDSVILAPATVALSATAADSDGTIAKVEFFSGPTKIGEAATAPYQATWTGVPSGSYTLTAVATDNYGATTSSTPVAIIVNAAPTVTLDAPASGTAFAAPANILLSATPADSDGTIAKVEFYQGTSKIGEATAAPYQFNWTNVPFGSYSLTARAIDNLGATKTSNAATVLVNAAPTVSITTPANNAFLQPATSLTISAAATDPDGTVAKVEFFNGATKLGELLSPTTAPSTFSFVLSSGLPSGKYSLTARATDNLGAATTTAAVAITVNSPPTATAMTVAATPGSAVPVTLTGSDPDGTSLTFAVVAPPQHGTLSGTAPNLTYTAAADFGGFDSFTYTANDGQLTSPSATVEITSNLPPRSHTYTTSADFQGGTLTGISTDVADQISNRTILASFDVIWIANSSKGTVVKLDSETGRAIGEFLTAPSSVNGPYPSRIAVDSKGNAWVANMSADTIVKIGLPQNGAWLDRNNNNVVDTSSGLGDIRAWTGTDASSATDEAILLYIHTGLPNVRHISVDSDDNVWVGTPGGSWLKYDGRSGQLLRTEGVVPQGGNGGFMTDEGLLYSAGDRFLIWDTSGPIASLPSAANVRQGTWASARDSKGNLWCTRDWTSTVVKYSPTGVLLGEYYHGEPWAMGIAIDANDHVWVAHSHCGHSVGHLLPDGTLVGDVPVANHGPVEVSIDRQGRIWVASSTGVVERINPLGGPLGADGVTPVGEVDLHSGNLGGALWTYGRFTGSTKGLTSPDGYWTAIFDGVLSNSTWGQAVWNGLVGNDGQVIVEAALSADGVNFTPFERLTPSNPTPGGTGRYLKTRVRLVSATSGETPTLYDLTVGTAGYAAPTSDKSWYVSAGPAINGNWPDTIQLQGAFWHTVQAFPTEPTYQWSLVSGPGTVSFSNPKAKRPTAQFSAQGTYVLQFAGTLNGVTSNATVTVTLAPYNRAPYANAGYTTFISTFPPQIWLWGETRDDGLPLNAALTTTWSKLFGPGTVAFTNQNAATTQASFSVPGVYTLQLSANDTQYTTNNTTDVWIGVPPPPAPPAGLVSWWEASGNGDDHVSGNQAFLEKSADYLTGKYGGAFHFNATNGRVRVFGSPSLDVGVQDGTSLEFWINPANTSATSTLIEFGQGTTRGVRARQLGNTIELNFRDRAGGDHILTTGAVLTNGAWTHIAGTYDRATGETRLFANGILQARTIVTGNLALSTGYDLYFGARADSTEPYNGLLDEISLYNRAIFADEVYTIATVGKRPPVSNLPPVVSAGPNLFNQHVNTPVTLNGTVTDDGQPTNGALTMAWSKVTGPGTVTFTNGNQATATATFSAPGLYVLNLRGDDAAFYTDSTVEVRVDAYGTVETDASLAAWWTANGTDVDVINGLKAERFHGAAYTDGMPDQAFSFDGSNDYAKVGAASALNVGTSSAGLTIELWVKPSVQHDTPLVEWERADGATEGVSLMEYNNNGNGFYGELTDTAGNPHEIAVGSGVFSANAWVHVALTYDKTTGYARLYRNSVLLKEQYLGVFTPQTTYPLVIGGRVRDNRYFQGALDELSVYNRPLTITEITAIYKASLTGKNPRDGNLPPVIHAGADTSIASAATSLTLNGQVTDDAKPAGSNGSVAWSQVSGPGTAQFGNQNAGNTSVTFPTPGTYILQLAANDGYKQGASDVTVVRVGVPGTFEPDSSLVAWWPANGDPHDVVHGHDVELYNGMGYDVGMVAQGFTFDGNNDHGRVAAHSDLNLGASAAGLTVELWVKPSVQHDTPLVEWERADGATEGLSLMEYNNNGNGFYAELTDTAGNPHEIALGSGVFTANTWVHVALTYDKTTGFARLYRNGVLLKEQGLGIFTPQTTYPLVFGGRVRENRYFQGQLDELSFYNRPLTITEINAIYQAGAIGKNPNDGNTPPVISAGPDVQVVGTGMLVALNGSATDDGKPLGGALNVAWSKVDGPGTPSFTNQNSAATTVSFDVAGTYVLKLAASDGAKQVSDTVVVRVGTMGVFQADASLAAWWPGNGDPREVVHGHDVELYNGMGYDVGVVSQAFTFDGNNDYGRVAAHSDLNVGASAAGLTIEMWVRPTVQHDTPLLEWERADGQADGLGLWEYNNNGNGFYAELNDTGGNPHEIAVTSGVFSANTWVHVALTYDKTTGFARLYRNGILLKEQNLGAFTPLTTYPLVFGGRVRENRYFQGQLDELSFYNRPLTMTEIAGIYQAGAVGKNPINGNLPPVVSAGPDVQITGIASVATLTGSVTDDGQPAGGQLKATWNQIDGPGQAQFGNRFSATTTATFDVPGTYVLQLVGSDGFTQSGDNVIVRVGVTGGVESDGSMVAWWPGNGDPHEVVHGHDLELFNGMSFAPGQISEAFLFDGQNDHGRVAAHPDLDIGASSLGLTIELWVRPSVQHDTPLLEWERADGQADGLGLWEYNNNGNGFYAELNDTGGNPHEIALGSGVFTANTWAHVALTYDKTTGWARLYRNGILLKEQNLGIFTPQTSLPIVFGGRIRENRYFQGLLDEVGFYARPLSIAEINAIYQMGAAGKNPVDDNQPPVVNAGPDVQIPSTSATATLSGTATDDGKPIGSTLATTWSKLSGPGGVTYGNQSSATTTATFDTAGTYVMQLTATDGITQTKDTMVVRVGIPTNYVPDGTLAGWWQGNADPQDVVHRHDMELYNGVTYDVGQVAQAFVFNGAGAHGRIPASVDTNIGASAAGLTIELWVKPTVQHDTPIIEFERADGQSDGLSFWEYNNNGNGFYGELNDTVGGTHEIAVTSGVFTANTWVHVALTYDKTTGFARLYRNGILLKEQNLGVFTPQTTFPMLVGGRLRENRYFQGQLDELAVYTRPLTMTEITAIYQAGAAGKAPFGANQPPSVSAGPDLSLAQATDTGTLNGVVLDDGRPAGNGVSVVWSQVQGPGTANFGNKFTAATTVTFTAAGTYILRLDASDGGLSASDTVVVRAGVTGAVATDASLVAWWPANGDPREVVHGHDLELYNGMGFDVGEVSGAFSFDGINDHGRAAAHSDLNVGASAAGLTLELWVKPTVQHDTQFLEFERADGQADGLSLMEYNNNGNGFYAELNDTVGGTHEIAVTSGVFTPNTWVHVALTYDKTTGLARLYRNGVIIKEQGLGVFTPQTSYPLVLGGRVRDNHYFQGLMDELGLFNRALTPSEITAIYQAGAAGKAPLPMNAPPAVVLDTPASGSSVAINTALTLHAVAADSDGSIAKVEFFDGATKLGEATSADAGQPTSFTLSLPGGLGTAGRHVLTARATDSGGSSTLSTVAFLNVAPVVPIVQITNPAQYANVATGVPVTIQATATYAGGAIAKVEFYDSGLKLGEVTSPSSGSTYTLVVNGGFGGGTHYLTANAIAVDTTSAMSAAVGVTATVVRPVVTWLAPAANSTTYNGAPATLQATATYAAGAIAKVEFYDGTTKVGEATTPDNGTTATYTFVAATGLPLGNRSVSARAIATDGGVATTPQVPLVSVLASPSVAITTPVNNANVSTTGSLTIRATATQPSGTIAKVEYFDNGTKLGETSTPDSGAPNSYSFLATAGFTAGSHALTAKATASNGTATTSAAVTVKAVAYSGDPVTTLTSPANTARISAPTAVMGVVAHPALASWTVEYRLKAAEGAATEAWTTLATGTSLVGTPGTNGNPDIPGTFGTFDPTSLINGIYELQLRVSDTAGGTTVVPAEPITVVVEGNMKVGVFSLAFEDLKVPVAGIPITVTRTYDSRDTRVGDFGPGWRLAVANIRVQKSRTIGRDWNQSDPPPLNNTDPFYPYYVTSLGGDRLVTIVMPDGETHRFRAGAYVKNTTGTGYPDNASISVPAGRGRMLFYPVGDTTSTLEPLDASNQLFETFYLMGTGDQDVYAQDPQVDFGAQVYDASRFRLTTKDGTVYLVDEVLGLLSMTDLNGNTMVINRDAQKRVTSIVSTLNTATPVTTSVTIHRDATGRVDYIRDPAGKDLDYLYDTQGRLSSFTNRELNVTQFFYENASFPYYLTRVVDPRGVNAIRTEYDANGKMTKQIDAAGKETVFNRGVDATGTFEKVKDRLGNETTLYYDSRGNVVLKIDPLGAQTSYVYYPDSDRVKLETDHYGNVKSTAYDGRGNIVADTLGADPTDDPANPTKGYVARTTYNAASAPTSITDPDGRLQTFTYDPETLDLLTQVVGASAADATAGDKTSYTYYPDGTQKTITDPFGNVTHYVYDYGFTDANYPGAIKKVTVEVTDPAGTAGSDSSNGTDTVLRTSVILYDAVENQVAQIVTRHLPDGSAQNVVTRYVYDSENRLRATMFPDGRVTETRYNASGKPDKQLLWQSSADYTSADDTRARITSYGYDARENQISVTYTDGSSEQAHFDAENRKDWSQDRRGYRTFFIYDSAGRLTTTIYPDADDGLGVAAPTSSSDSRLKNNPRSQTTYDLIGRVLTEVDERGATTEYTYENGCGCSMRRKQVIQHRTTGDLVTFYAYDKAGHVVDMTDPRGNVIETQYDNRGRPTFTIYPATDEHPSTNTEARYDSAGHRIAFVDQEGKITRYRYDGLGQLVEVRAYLDQALGATDADYSHPATASGIVSTRYTYDEAGNQTSQIDALGRTTTFWTDTMGRRTKRVLPSDTNTSAASETMEYDGWGNLWKVTDFSGKTTTFGYDALNRLTSKLADTTHPSLSYSNAAARIEYEYDANGGRRSARSYNGANVLLYSESTPRDERGRASYKDTAIGRLSYTYYANSLLNDVVSSNTNGINVGYRYDEANRLVSLDDGSTGAIHTTSFTYNANGSLETMTQPNAVVHTYNYDALNRLRGLIVSQLPTGSSQPTILHTYEYKLDTSGHRHQVIEGGRTTTYNYDALYRLTGETIAGDAHGNNGAVSYVLDKVGNRQSRDSGLPALGSQLGQTYNARDWLGSDSYDANGNTTSGKTALGDPSATDVYDFENRLIVRANSDGTTINITYDGDGNRISKSMLDAASNPTSTTSFLVDMNNLTGYAQVVEERTSVPSGVTLKVYTYGNQLISQTATVNNQSATVSYYAFDGHDNVRELTNAVGALTDRYDYDAFGNLLLRSGTTPNAYLYCSEQYDSDLGLYYLRARYMNPNSGRFWEMDSFEGKTNDPSTLHKYLYTNGSPVDASDPSGMMTFVDLMEAVGLDKILDNMANVRAIHRWRAIQARICAVTATLLKPMVIAYNQLKKVTKGLGGLIQAHHVIQDAFVEAQVAYSSGRGLAVLLLGGSQFALSPHDLANKVQAKNAAMRAIDKAWYALRVAGCRNSDATTIVDFVKMDYEIAGIVF